MKSGTKKGLGLAAVAAAVYWLFLRKKWVDVPGTPSQLGVLQFPATQGRTYLAWFGDQASASAFADGLVFGGGAGSGVHAVPASSVSPAVIAEAKTGYAVEWVELKGEMVVGPSFVNTLAGYV